MKPPSLVVSPEIMNSKFKVETSNPKTFESGKLILKIREFLTKEYDLNSY